MTIFDAILLANAIGSIQPIDPTKGADFYYTAFQPNHIECVSLEDRGLMLCPSNALNRSITPSEEIDRDVLTWRVPAGCNELSDNVELCEKRKGP
jgi:hypothetical protein